MGLFKGRRGAHQADLDRTLLDKLENPSGPLRKKKEWSPSFGVRTRLFWQSGKGKILLDGTLADIKEGYESTEEGLASFYKSHNL